MTEQTWKNSGKYIMNTLKNETVSTYLDRFKRESDQNYKYKRALQLIASQCADEDVQKIALEALGF